MSTENKPGALRSKGRRMLTEATEEAWANEPNASNTRVMSIFAATAAELLDGAVEHIEKLEAQLEAVGAGGMEPLRKRCLHQISEPQAQPVASESLVKWASLIELAQTDWHTGYEAARAYVKVQLECAAPQPAAQALDAPVATPDPRITAIEQSILDYHYALDTRQHGGVAAANALDAICTAMSLPWIQGAEFARRAAIAAQQGGTA